MIMLNYFNIEKNNRNSLLDDENIFKVIYAKMV